MSMKRRVIVGLFICLALWLVATPVLADGQGAKAIFGRDYVLEPGEKLDDDLVVVRGRVHLQRGSTVRGNVLVMGGEATLEGRVEGDVVAMGGAVQIASSAVIEGDLVVFGEIHKQPGAQVRGNTIEGLEATVRTGGLPDLFFSWPGVLIRPPIPLRPYLPARPGGDVVGSFAHLLRAIASVLLILLVAVAVVAILPQNLNRVTQVMHPNWLLSLVMGLLTVIVGVILIPLLVITCIGIPVAVVVALALFLCAAMGWIAAGSTAGHVLRQWLNLRGWSPLLEALLGILAITLFTQIPCIGPISAILLVSWGVGAVVLTRFGTVPYPPPAPVAGPVPPTTPVAGNSQVPDAGTPPSEPDSDTRRLDQSELRQG